MTPGLGMGKRTVGVVVALRLVTAPPRGWGELAVWCGALSGYVDCNSRAQGLAHGEAEAIRLKV